MSLDDLTFRQIKELQKLFTHEPNSVKKEDRGINIVVLLNGWIYVGKLEKNGNEFTLSNCANIRKWGTTGGLGQIAKDGPTDNTIMDKSEPITFNEVNMIHSIKCNGEKWKCLN